MVWLNEMLLRWYAMKIDTWPLPVDVLVTEVTRWLLKK